MEEFKGNSNASKENNKPLDREPLAPITSNVKVRKEEERKSKFFAEDARTVGGHVFTSVVVPGLQKLVSDIVKNGVDWLIYGSKAPTQRSGGISNIGYTRYYDYNKSSTIPPIPASAAQRASVYTINEIIFDDRGTAESVLMNLKDIIARYGMVSVADFYDLIAQNHTYTDNKYGWTDLSQVGVERVRDGYAIGFPKAVPIE